MPVSPLHYCCHCGCDDERNKAVGLQHCANCGVALQSQVRDRSKLPRCCRDFRV